MNGELAKGSFGDGKGSYEVKFEGGKLIASSGYDAGLAGAKAEVSVDSDAVLDALAKAIPGTIDDMVLALAKKMLKGE